jgi:succinate dehydrogenase flavin-adding protein (antitoxin of CptAB toxin-antitoxin module)
MRGRKKTQNPKSEHIRITFRTRAGLLELSRILKMPPYYKEGDIIEALIRLMKSQLAKANFCHD